MKIAVTTFWDSNDNYGQLLQCYALQEYLKKLGHEPFLVRYRQAPAPRVGFKWKNLPKYLSHLPAYGTLLTDSIAYKLRMLRYGDDQESDVRKFKEFLNANIALSPVLSKEELYTNPPSADAYICGSDQIWGGDEAYYLSYAPEGSVKIAYAPSFGGIEHFSEEYEQKLKRLLSDFLFLGLREQSGVDLCHRLGFSNAVKTIDPTLLLCRKDYNNIRIKTSRQRPYMFLYLLGNPISPNVTSFFRYAKSKGLDIVYVASQNRIDRYSKVYPQIGEWIDYISNASLVVTNSFHCTVFSLLYEKKFMTVPLVKEYKRMNGRIEELLHECRMDFALCGDRNFRSIFERNYDFGHFRDYCRQEEIKSRQYLQNSLKIKR